ncbi:transcriptional regulator [Rhodococcus sp. 06-1477-1B]|nr:transcriptional regulator [Rhodococcus sp. 06-1477-1B]
MTTQDLLDDRYGRTRSPRRRIAGWTIVAVLALGATGYLGWTTFASSAASVTATDTGFTVTGDKSVTASFQITAPVGKPVACALEARDEDHGTVGWRVVQYPASDDASRAFTETIPTLSLATTGFVNACWVP